MWKTEPVGGMKKKEAIMMQSIFENNKLFSRCRSGHDTASRRMLPHEFGALLSDFPGAFCRAGIPQSFCTPGQNPVLVSQAAQKGYL